MVNYEAIKDVIREIVNRLPPSVVRQLAADIRDISDVNHLVSRNHVLSSIVNPQARELVVNLLDAWSNGCSELTSNAVAFALESAGSAVEYSRNSRTIDLVWTGPIIHQVNLRHTESVLLELIRSAQTHLHIVSFAVYKATRIIDALLHALERNVSISIYLETMEHSKSRSGYDVKRTLGNELTQKANIYSWAGTKRKSSPNADYGLLHAKTAVADSERYFISSANLTDYAMSLNIELGVLIQDRDTAMKIVTQLRLLVENDIFVLI
jgi:phosphatidylserine/phosphatidylglycerophosphate/cardiolipin synthase-like enzyme